MSASVETIKISENKMTSDRDVANRELQIRTLLPGRRYRDSKQDLRMQPRAESRVVFLGRSVV